MKLMLRVSSESKYSFFNRKVIEHIVEKMDVVVISGSLTCFVQELWRASLIFKTLGCKSCLRCESSSKAGLKVFREESASWWHTLQTGQFFFRRNLLKVDERESGELFEELFWNDVAYFFPMNINFCNLIFERRRNGNDIFSLQNRCRGQIFLRSQRCFSRTEETLLSFSGIFFFEAEAVSIEQIAVLVVFSEKKCNFKSMSRFAVVEFEDIGVTFFLVEHGWLIKISWKSFSSFFFAIDVFGDKILHI